MIIVDPHAFDSLWRALAVWLLLFLTAGDAWTIVRRQCALAFGVPVEAVVEDKRGHWVSLSYEAGGARRRSRETVGRRGWTAVKVGSRRRAHALWGAAFLDDDLGYSLWKLSVFLGAFAALWVWAVARYRFG